MRKEIREILERLAFTINVNTFAHIGNEKNMVGAVAEKKMKEGLNLALIQIISTIKEGLPKKRIEDEQDTYDAMGYNHCLQDILEVLDEPGNETKEV